MTEPLTPVDCDLRGLDYMPLFGNHLFGSEFNAAATDAEWRAAVTLWWAAWNQVPAGSLPNDDGALCRLADLGRDVKGWRKLRERALHGFVLCTDGRLYHEFICKQALVAWDKRVKERERKAKWRAEQDAKKAGLGTDVPRDTTGTPASGDATVRADVKGRDGTGRDSSSEANASAGGAGKPRVTDPDTIIFGYGVPLLTAAGSEDKHARSFLGGLRKHHGDTAVIDKLRECIKAKPLQPLEWLAAALPPEKALDAPKPWHDTRAGIEGKGEELGLGRWDQAEWEAGRREAWPVYEARVFAAAGHSPRAAA